MEKTRPAAGPSPRRRSLQFKKVFRFGEFLIENVIKAVSLTTFAIILLIFIFVFREALPLFSEVVRSASPDEELIQETYGEDPPTDELAQETYGEDPSGEEVAGESAGESHTPPEPQRQSVEDVPQDMATTLWSLLGATWQPVSGEPKFGIMPLIVGSLKVTFISILFAAPIAILAALYTAVFANKKVREVLKPAIELLSGFPSVVIGFFALITVATFFQSVFGYEYRLNAFVGGIALSLAVIPIIFTVTEDALSTIPKVMTEASLALGATKWQTALFVILPAATPGVFAAILLGVGRAFGETMIVLMATGNASLMSWDIFEPVRTMSATIGAEMAEVVFGDTHYNVLFFIGSLLFIFTFILNAVAEFYVRARLMKRFGGGS